MGFYSVNPIGEQKLKAYDQVFLFFRVEAKLTTHVTLISSGQSLRLGLVVGLRLADIVILG